MLGMEMMLTNMLKAFMPKESAEKIAGWASDGTFDKIGNLPSELEAIKLQQAQILLGMGRIFAILQERDENGIPGSPAPGPLPLALVEHGADGEPGNDIGASGEPDSGHGGSAGPAGSVGEETPVDFGNVKEVLIRVGAL